MAFNMNKLTEKAQEAIVAAQRAGRGAPQHPARAGAPAARAGRAGRRRRAGRAGEARRPAAQVAASSLEPALERACARAATPQQVYVSTALPARLRGRPAGGRAAEGRVRLAPSTSCWRWPMTGAGAGGQILRRARRHPRPRAAGAAGGARRPARHPPEPRDDLPVAGEVRPRPDRAGPRRASSTRSSAATRRSAASSRCCRGAPRTTRC